MISNVIKSKVHAGQIILYRRVSTPQQAKDDYRHQLQIIKSKYNDFSIAHATISDVSEVISGRSDAGKRMPSGLGKCIKLLKRHPHAIVIVSRADRIARRADIFTLIQKQGLGNRILDAATGMSVDDIVDTDLHIKIENQTEAQCAARKTGRERYQQAGGVLGSKEISKHSQIAAKKKIYMAKKRQSEVLNVVSRLTYRSKGQRPPLTVICDELERLGIHTGQGRFFTPERLSQLGKRHPHGWRSAFDSYVRPRRRIRRLITATQIEIRNGRHRRVNMKRLVKLPLIHTVQVRFGFKLAINSNYFPPSEKHPFPRCGYRNACRGPPTRTDLVSRQHLRLRSWHFARSILRRIVGSRDGILDFLGLHTQLLSLKLAALSDAYCFHLVAHTYILHAPKHLRSSHPAQGWPRSPAGRCI